MAPPKEEPDRYTYDPMDVRPVELEHNGANLGWWPHHYLSITRPILPLNPSPNGLVYETAPLEEDLEISGFPKLTAWISLDTPDTDFQLMLYEVFPDGRSLVLAVDHMRARYRESQMRQKLIEPGEINRYEFRTFTFVARRVAKGSRLRLVLMSPNSIFAEKNYNSGGLVSHESGKDARTVHVIVYHDAEHPSSLSLPPSDDASASSPRELGRPTIANRSE